MHADGTDMREIFQATLLGLAVGDALGAPVEFVSRREILLAHGPEGITDLEPWDEFPSGTYTDDTQMALATAEGLVDAMSEARRQPISDPVPHVYRRYLAWLETQDDPAECRRPGNTCLSALQSGRVGTPDDPINDSKGAGGIMRIAPVGLAHPPVRAFETGCECAAITHGHPSGWLAAGCYADILSRIVRGEDLRHAIAEVREILVGYEDFEEVLEKIDQAVELFVSDTDLDSGFALLGEGWIAEEALGIALFCVLNFPAHFYEGVLAAVNITGDSDTTGALAGALLGAQVGPFGIPGEWVARLENAGGIATTADALYDAAELAGAVG
jgi:ADP-ribosylglycohydrolase